MLAAQAEKARKKRERKKAAKKEAQGKLTFDGRQLATNGKIAGSEAGAEREGWHSASLQQPSPAMVKSEKPASRDDHLRSMGFGRLERERVETFQRLQRLTGLSETYPELESEMGPSISQQLEQYVESAGKVDDITDARQICAKLCNIADDLIAGASAALFFWSFGAAF